MRRLFLLTLALLGVLQAASAAAPPRYTLTRLPWFTRMGIKPTGINIRGQVVGFAVDVVSNQLTSRAFLWDPVSGIRDLGTLPGYDGSEALGINDVGQVVGYAYGAAATPSQAAFLWDEAGGMREIEVPGHYRAIATSINNRGQVAIWTAGYARAVVWDAGTFTVIHTYPQIAEGLPVPVAINEVGQVAGYQEPAGHVWIWDPVAGVTDLGALPGAGSRYFYKTYDLNDLGQVVGDAGHAFLWDKATGMQDLGALPGGRTSWARGINNHSQVVGASEVAYGDRIYEAAVLWQDGQIFKLNDLVDYPYPFWLDEAVAINDAGQIAATQSYEAYLLTPVPEPASLSALALGLVPLAAAAVNRRRHGGRRAC